MKDRIVKILFHDDEGIIRDVFGEKFNRWKEDGVLGKQMDARVVVQGPPQESRELHISEYDILILDQIIDNQAYNADNLLKTIDFKRQYVIIISQDPYYLMPLYGDDKVIANFGRIVLLPKAQSLKASYTSGGNAEDVLREPWWDSVLCKWLKELCKRVIEAKN